MKIRADIVRRTICNIIVLPKDYVISHRNDFPGLAFTGIRFLRLPSFVTAWRIQAGLHTTDWLPINRGMVERSSVYSLNVVFQKNPAHAPVLEIYFQVKSTDERMDGEYEAICTFANEYEL